MHFLKTEQDQFLGFSILTFLFPLKAKLHRLVDDLSSKIVKTPLNQDGV